MQATRFQKVNSQNKNLKKYACTDGPGKADLVRGQVNILWL